MIRLQIQIPEPYNQYCNDCYLSHGDCGEADKDSLAYCHLFCCHLKEIENNLLRCKKCLNAEKVETNA